MKYVKASMRTHDAAIGPVLIGETYFVEDDKAERWVNSGIATIATAPPPQPPAPDPQPIPTPEPEPPSPPPEEDEQDDDENQEADAEEDDDDPAHLKAEAHKLHEEGLSERGIAQQLGISRTRVHSLLSS